MDKLEEIMAKATSQLREHGEQAIARSGGDVAQAFNWLSRLVENDKNLTACAIKLGVGQVIRAAQNTLRAFDSTEGLSDFIRKLSQNEAGAANVLVNPIAEEDIVRLQGRFLYPLHKNGVYIGLATETNIVESIQEIERQENGLASSKAFELAALRQLRKKRKKPTDRVMDVISQEEIDKLYEKFKVNFEEMRKSA